MALRRKYNTSIIVVNPVYCYADLRVHGQLLYLLVLLGGHVAGVPVLLQRLQHLCLGLVAAGQAQHAEAVVSQLGLETRVNFSIYN